MNLILNWFISRSFSIYFEKVRINIYGVGSRNHDLYTRYEGNKTKQIESSFSHSIYESVREGLDKDIDEV